MQGVGALHDGRPTVNGGATILSVPPIVMFTVTVVFSLKRVENTIKSLSVHAATALLYIVIAEFPWLTPSTPVCRKGRDALWRERDAW